MNYVKPNFDPILNAALLHHQAGRLADAEKNYRRYLNTNPKHSEALHGLALLEWQAGRRREAEDQLRNVIANEPKHFLARTNLAMLLIELSQIDDAIAAARAAIAVNPQHAMAHNALGIALSHQSNLDESIAAHAEAVRLHPARAQYHCNLGNVLWDRGRLDDAVAEFHHALKLDPHLAMAHNNLGNVLKDMALHNDSLQEFRRAIADAPKIHSFSSNLVYLLPFHADFSDAQILSECRAYSDRHEMPLQSRITPPNVDRTPNRKLRIGYVSPDFRDHVVGWNVLPIFREHDRSKCEIFAYAHVARPDDYTRNFKSLADYWRDIAFLNDDQLAELIRKDRIDILVDLALHMGNNRLGTFARKPAPIQVTFAGYPGGTGLKSMDYRLTDPYLDPIDTDGNYQEKSIRLPHSFWCYDPAAMGMENQPITDLPADSAGHITFGCLCNFCKVSPGTLGLWSKILKKLSDTKLILLTPPGSCRQRVIAALDVDPSRIEFVEKAKKEIYLGHYKKIDIALDPQPYGGHVTSLDALWMGVPLVTRMGSTVVGRAGVSILSNLDHREWIAANAEEYVQIASNLASDREKLRKIRKSLRERFKESKLTDAKGFTRAIEGAFEKMWKDSQPSYE